MPSEKWDKKCPFCKKAHTATRHFVFSTLFTIFTNARLVMLPYGLQRSSTYLQVHQLKKRMIVYKQFSHMFYQVIKLHKYNGNSYELILVKRVGFWRRGFFSSSQVVLFSYLALKIVFIGLLRSILLPSAEIGHAIHKSSSSSSSGTTIPISNIDLT